MKDGREPDWPALDEGAEPTRTLGDDRFPASDEETAADLIAPVLMYPLFENALWARAGGTIEEHRARLGELWASFSTIAARNEHAWSRRARGAEEIATPGEGNRLVSLPYTKLLNSHIQTDQAAALILCSAETATGARRPARSLGLPARRRPRLRPLVRQRARGPALLPRDPRRRRAPRCTHAGLTIDAVDRLDIYSCFPSAVQIACAELGIDAWMDERPLTVTGGLTFAGGPGNNYVTHSIAQLAERLRESEGATGLVTAVGWYMTKHAAGVYGNAPPQRSRSRRCARRRRSTRRRAREVARGYAGAATGEAATLLYDVFGTADDRRRHGAARRRAPRARQDERPGHARGARASARAGPRGAVRRRRRLHARVADAQICATSRPRACRCG